MSETKHTPGPWVIRSRPGGWDGISTANGTPICAIEENNLANARLIAAAPELLASLTACVGYLLNAKIDLETGAKKATAINTIEGGIRQARVAISKAQQEAS